MTILDTKRKMQIELEMYNMYGLKVLTDHSSNCYEHVMKLHKTVLKKEILP